MKPKKLKVAPIRPAPVRDIDTLWPLPVSYRCTNCNRILLTADRCPLKRGCRGHGEQVKIYRAKCTCTRWTCGAAELYVRCRACHRRIIPMTPEELEALL